LTPLPPFYSIRKDSFLSLPVLFRRNLLRAYLIGRAPRVDPLAYNLDRGVMILGCVLGHARWPSRLR